MSEELDAIDDDDKFFESLPADPEQAFLVLEKHFRVDCESRIARAHQDENTRVFYVDYIAQVLATINELGLKTEFQDRVPTIETVDFDTYLNFSKDVKHFRTMLQIRHGRRVQGHSVQFDFKTKEKVRHLLGQLRDIFDKLEIEQEKREALFSKLNELEIEVDRDRTRFDSYAALAIEVAGVAGEVVEKSQIRGLLDSVAKVIWGARKEEDMRRLPPPTKPKQIEHKNPSPSATKGSNIDDEIPF